MYTDGAYPVSAWALLREVFEQVTVIARVQEGAIGEVHRRADGDGVTFAAVPEFVGAGGLAKQSAALARVTARAVKDADVVLLRAPGVIASAAFVAATAMRKKYAIEIVGDPRESLETAGIGHLGRVNEWLLRRQVRGAIASRYVTERTLQERYPPPAGQMTVAASDLGLPDAVFDAPAPAIEDKDVLHVGWVGALARPYKGVDVLIDAMARTQRPHRLTLVGDGALRPQLEAQARPLGGRVTFAGALPAGDAVFAFLRTLDLFVLPSRTEGLPRALVEAMAVGLPALATPVGGVPELLAEDARVPVGDPAALARRIDELAADPAARRAMAERNRARVASFRQGARRERLTHFYRAIADAAHD